MNADTLLAIVVLLIVYVVGVLITFRYWTSRYRVLASLLWWVAIVVWPIVHVVKVIVREWRRS